MPKHKLAIGIFTNMLLEPSGIAEATRRLIKGLGRSGHEVHVFTPHDDFTAKNVEFHKCGGFRISRDPEYYFSLPLFNYFRANQGTFRDLG